MKVAALFVESGGCYSNLPDVDAWPIDRDARLYAGPWPVVAHPPCERWGRYWHGLPRKPHQYRLGDDNGCFIAALRIVRTFGGVIEHPAWSHAWDAFRLPAPLAAGWLPFPGDEWFCQVEQGHYGHMARKATWLFVKGPQPPELIWGPAPQRLSEIALERHGYEKARRTGVMAYVGGKDKKAIRSRTPIAFRDLLLDIARQCGRRGLPAAPVPCHSVDDPLDERIEPLKASVRLPCHGSTMTREGGRWIPTERWNG